MRAASAPVSMLAAASPPSAVSALIAEALHHGFEQPALHRVVVDDEHGFGHHRTPNSAVVPIWCNVGVLA